MLFCKLRVSLIWRIGGESRRETLWLQSWCVVGCSSGNLGRHQSCLWHAFGVGRSVDSAARILSRIRDGCL